MQAAPPFDTLPPVRIGPPKKVSKPKAAASPSKAGGAPMVIDDPAPQIEASSSVDNTTMRRLEGMSISPGPQVSNGLNGLF